MSFAACGVALALRSAVGRSFWGTEDTAGGSPTGIVPWT